MTGYPHYPDPDPRNPKMQALRYATRLAEQRCREAVWAFAVGADGQALMETAERALYAWMDAVMAEVDAAGPPPAEPCPECHGLITYTPLMGPTRTCTTCTSVDWTDPRWGDAVRFAEPIREEEAESVPLSAIIRNQYADRVWGPGNWVRCCGGAVHHKDYHRREGDNTLSALCTCGDAKDLVKVQNCPLHGVHADLTPCPQCGRYWHGFACSTRTVRPEEADGG